MPNSGQVNQLVSICSKNFCHTCWGLTKCISLKTECIFALDYVEDNQANLALMEELIARSPDLRLISAADGNLGINYARTYQPKVILMDLHLPGISGIEAMKILRADLTTAHIPVVAVSAYASSADIALALDAGCFNYITKPIKLNEFMVALDVALRFSQRCSALAFNRA
jgi:CheY-like chemotaxis protein